MSTTIKCDLCGRSDYELVYKPIGTKRDVDVALCRYCGLMFSIVKDVPYSRAPNPSCDADWGNVRFCKGQRFDVLKKDMPALTDCHVLDVGSSRGHFVKWANTFECEVTALEHDTRIADCPVGMEFYGCRVEDAELPQDYYNFVYCCQTLEHTDSATKVLEAIHRAMKMDGVLFLEVPNTPEVLKFGQNTEEYFIDKHNYHFTHETIEAYLNKTGFKVYSKRDDRLNVSVFAFKTDTKTPPPQADHRPMKALVAQYAENIAKNRQKVATVVHRINDILDTGMKTAFWGANTMLDLMVKYGKLDPKRVEFLADDYMCDCIDQLHGIPIHSSEDFRVFQPEAVIILARFNADVMAEKARRFGIRNVIKFNDLLGMT